MRILALADVHGRYELFAPEQMPACDLAVIAGDITKQGLRDTRDFVRSQDWMWAIADRFPILWIPGNHDFLMDYETYLPRQGQYFITNILNRFCGYLDATFYGVSLSPCYDMPELAHVWVHMTARREVEEAAFGHIPPMTGVIVSHSPPFGVLDLAPPLPGKETGRHVGSKALLAHIQEHRPKIVICGHIHEGTGHARIGQTDVYNVACQWREIEIGTPAAESM